MAARSADWQLEVVARSLGRVTYPVWLSLVRLRARRAQTVVAVAGVAAAAGALAAIAAGSLVAQDRSVERRVASIPGSQRAVVATWGGTSIDPADAWPHLDRAAVTALAGVDRRPPERVAIFPEKVAAGTAFNLGAIDGLSRWVTVTSGRLPRRCSATACEVVQAGGRRTTEFPGIRVVGRVTLRPDSPLAPYLTRSSGVLLLGDDVPALARVAPLEGTFHSFGWVLPLVDSPLGDSPLRPSTVHAWRLRPLLGDAARADAALRARSQAFDVTLPTAELEAARSTAHVAGRRLLLIGGGAVALLLAFAALVAARARPWASAVARRLSWYGARGWQLALVRGVEAALIAVTGTAVGWVLGALGGAVVAEAAGVPAWEVLSRSVFSPAGLLLAAGLASAAAIVLVLALSEPRATRGRLSPLVVAAIAALAVVAVAVARGEADPAEVGGGTGALLLLLPGLVTFGVAVLFSQVVPPALRAGERLSRRAGAPVRLAVVSLARDPRAASVPVVFLAVAIAVALFSASYGATLSANITERASYAVPADYVLRERSGLIPPLAADGLGRTVPVIRAGGNAVSLSGRRAFTLLGVPAEEIADLEGWRSDFASEPLDDLAGRLRSGPPEHIAGVALPQAARTLSLPIEVRGDPVTVTANLRARDGRYTAVVLGEADAGHTMLRAGLPPAARGGMLVALRVGQPLQEAFSAGHHDVGSEGIDSVSRGTFVLGRPSAGGRELRLDDWIGTGGLRARDGAVRYLVGRAQLAQLRPHQPGDGVPIPVLVSPALAEAADRGVLPLDVRGDLVPTRVVGTVRRFPSAFGDVVVADESRLDVALNTIRPGLGSTGEAWLHAPASAATALAGPRFRDLEVRSRRGLEDSLRTDPLARGALAILWATAAIALALAITSFALGALAATRDRRSELFDLEAQGLAPRELRRRLNVQAALVALFGAVGGILAGLVLTALTVDVVAVTANAMTPVPPFRLRVPWLEAAAIASAAIGLGLVCATTVSRRDVSGAVPVRPEEVT